MEYLSGVKFHGKPPGIPESFRTATLMDNSGESNNHRCLNSGSSKEISTCKTGNIMSDLKEALGTGTSSMDNTFRNPLTIKISKFLY